MKKIIYLSLIVFCLTGCKKKLADNIETVVDEKLSEKQSEEKQDNQEINKLIVSEQVKGEDFFNLEPLAENETLEIKFDDELYSFLIYKIHNQNSELYYNTNSDGWIDIYLSNDKKKVLYALHSNIDYKLYYYLLDGISGVITFIGRLGVEIEGNCCPSKNFTYLIVTTRQDNYPALKVQSLYTLEEKSSISWDNPIENPDMEGETGHLELLAFEEDNIKSLQEIFKKNDLIMQLDEGDFDCIVILAGSETECYGYGYFNAETGKFIKHMEKFYMFYDYDQE